MNKKNMLLSLFVVVVSGGACARDAAVTAPSVPHKGSNSPVSPVQSAQPAVVEKSVPKSAQTKKAVRVKKTTSDVQESAPVVQKKAAQNSESTQKPVLYTVDDIVVVIYAQEGTEIITQSDLDRPTLEGAPRTLDETIFERLLFLDAKKYKMIADEDAIDKHLATVQRQNNMTLDELKAVFKASGYTYEEGREQFGIMYAVNQVIDFKIRSRLIVPEKDVLAYYNANPVMLEPSYQVARAVIPYGKAASKDELRKELATFKGVGISWEEPFWVNQGDLAESKRFVMGMPVGAVSEPQEIDAGYELIKLVDKKGDRLAPLEERYREIVDILRKPKYDEVMADYKKTLFDSSSIVYLKQESKAVAQVPADAQKRTAKKSAQQESAS
ncbi:hypothetical protein CVU75_02490 [Candidatus Dependentiae bacterium HGW-Dependentiae-1]|nr:MAG: hypothetical protein CVU75_02490 [Candidatus Dependentiae bacterium HGW-Dependentiae-1]